LDDSVGEEEEEEEEDGARGCFSFPMMMLFFV
jgi:hypothetical protein